MPISRFSAGTKIRDAGELTSRPLISISPPSGRSKPGDAAKRRRLAAAARPKQNAKIALGDFQIDVAERVYTPCCAIKFLRSFRILIIWSSLSFGISNLTFQIAYPHSRDPA